MRCTNVCNVLSQSAYRFGTTLQAPEQSSLTAIAKEYSIPYSTLMTLQHNNKAVHHTVVLGRYCSTTQSSRPPSW